VARPRVALAVRALDEEELRSICTGAKHDRNGGLLLPAGRQKLRLVRRDAIANAIEGEHVDTILDQDLTRNAGYVGPMSDRTTPAAMQAPSGRELLRLARDDKAAAQKAMASLTLVQQLSVLCDTPPSQRAKLLDLAPSPEDLVPIMPEAELCFTVKAIGLADASWLMAYARPEQVVACTDLDVWNGFELNRRTMDGWLAIVAEAGEPELLTALRSLDAELIVLYLQGRIQVELKPNGDDNWEPSEGTETLDGQFYWRPIDPSESGSLARLLLRVLFTEDYWLYFRFVQGVIWELPTELSEWAMRWRAGRVEDLGFPSWDTAMRIYGYLRPEKRIQLPPPALDLAGDESQLPILSAQLPVSAANIHSIFLAAQELEEAEQRAFLLAFVTLANKVAVADRLSLGDSETLPVHSKRPRSLRAKASIT
jgi:hypothetical protein